MNINNNTLKKDGYIMKRKTRILLAVLAAALFACFLCLPASAVKSGYCGATGSGTNLQWKVDGNTLTISGNDAMKDYSSTNLPPWTGAGLIEHVVIENGCTGIGTQAFYNMSTPYIKSVSLPETLKWISDSAFYMCQSLSEINIPSSVKTIYNAAFYGCKALESVTLPEGLSAIGPFAFSATGLREVTIPGTVEVLSMNAFGGCSNLEKVTLSEGLKTINSYAFVDCKKLTEITIPSTVTTIGSSAFGNTGLKKVTDLSHATISADAFPTPTDTCGDDITWEFNFIRGELKITGTGAIPDYENSTAPWADYKYNIESVVISEGITSVGKFAFRNYPNLAVVTLPSTVKEIRERAFEYCSSLTILKLSQNLTNIGENAFAYSGLPSIVIPDSVQTIERQAFMSCASLESVVLGKGLTAFGERVFQECKALTSVEFRCTKLESIGNYAFKDCTSLSDINGTIGSVSVIGRDAFQNCTALTDSSFNAFKGLININDGAFMGCTSLVNITLPDSLTTIGNSAFSGCEGLETVTGGNNVVTIGGDAFRSCCKLKSFAFGDMLTSIGTSAFFNCKALTDVTFSDTLQTIDSGAFQLCTSLKNVTFGNGLSKIGDNAFLRCTSLTNVTFGNSLTTIGTDAFHDCKALGNVVLPESLTTIGNYAFYNTAITSVSVPKNVTSIGDAAFSTGKLESITVDAANTNFIISGNCLIDTVNHVLLAAGSDPVIPVDGSVTKIGKYAFYCSAITEVTLPGSVTELNFNAFDSCTGLTEVTLPETLKVIGQCAFKNCTSLKTVIILAQDASIEAKSAYDGKQTFPSTTTVYAYESAGIKDYAENFKAIYYGTLTDTDITWRLIAGELEITGTGDIPVHSENDAPWSAYRDSIRNVIISGNISTIGGYAFYNCAELTSVKMVDNTTEIFISTFAFAGCSKLESITTTGKWRIISAWAFADCYSLKGFDFGDRLYEIGIEAFRNCTSISSVSLPHSLQKLEGDVFLGCTSLTSLDFPEENYYFSGKDNMIFASDGKKLVLACQGLKEITIPEGVTEIGSDVFRGNTLLEKINFPDNLWVIGDYAFKDCTALKEFVIPESVTSLGNYAFKGCSGLVSITFPPAVGVYGDYVFAECTSLRSVNFPENISCVPIGKGMFRNCTALEEIVIPNAYTTIGNEAFDGCTLLKKVTILSKQVDFPNSFVGNVFPDGTVLRSFSGSETQDFVVRVNQNGGNLTFEALPGGSCGEDLTWWFFNGALYIEGTGAMSDYEGSSVSSAPWEIYEIKRISISEGVTSIGAYAFRYTELNEIKLPSSLITIGKGAFYGSSFITITLPDSITTIGDEAFVDCRELISVRLPESLTSFGNGVFTDCKSLKSVTISEENTAYSVKGNSLIENADGRLVLVWDLGTSYTVPDGVRIIGAQVFSGRADLVSVNIPEGVTEIEKEAFRNCGISAIKLPKSLKKIGDSAFAECGDLESLILRDGLTDIGDNAFSWCGIKSLTVPGSVVNIGSGAFAGCESLSELTLIYGIRTISDSMFANCRSLRTVIIPVSVTEICSSAFIGCGDIDKFVVTSKDTTIAADAFSSDAKIAFCAFDGSKAKTFAESNPDFFSYSELIGGSCGDDLIWYIVDDTLYIDGTGNMTVYDPEYSKWTPWAYYDYSNVYIGRGVSSISESAFLDTAFFIPKIESFTVAEGNANIREDGNCLINGTTVIAVCMDGAVIPADGSVTAIGRFAFAYYNGTDTISIPSSITSIGNCAFRRNRNLGEIRLGDNVEYIGDMAFYESSVKKVRIGRVKKLGKNIFENCDSLTEVEINTDVGDYMFTECENLVSATLGVGVTVVGENAFYSCGSLEKVTLSEGLLVIGKLAFNSCRLTEIELPSTLTHVSYAALSHNYVTKIHIPKNVTEIEPGAFGIGYNASESKIESITVDPENERYTSIGNCLIDKRDKVLILGCKNSVIPQDAGLITIGKWAFAYTNIESVVIPSTVTLIDEEAFSFTWNLTSIKLSEGLKTIGNRAFLNASALKSIVIPDGVTEIGGWTFYGCRNLSAITLPKSLRRIGDDAFGFAYALTAISLPEGLETIGKSAFQGTLLTSIVIPASVKEVGAYALNISSLNDIVVLSKDAVYGEKVFYITKTTDQDSEGNKYEVISAPYVYCFKGSTADVIVWAATKPSGPSYVINGGVFLLDGSVYSENSVQIHLGESLSISLGQYRFRTDFLMVNARLVVSLGSKTVEFRAQNIDHDPYFTFDGISPQQMNDTITYKLVIGNSDIGEVVLFERKTTIKECLEEVLDNVAYNESKENMTPEEAAAYRGLIYSLLNYGTAAQEYTDHNTGSLVGEGYEDKLPTFTEEDEVRETDKGLTGNAVEGIEFTEHGLRFSTVNQVYFRFAVPEAVDMSKVTLVQKDKAGQIIATYDAKDFLKNGNIYTWYSSGIYASSLIDDSVYTMTLLYDGKEGQTVTYSVRSFVYSFQNRTDASGSLTREAKLARATWLYGLAASKFNELDNESYS